MSDYLNELKRREQHEFTLEDIDRILNAAGPEMKNEVLTENKNKLELSTRVLHFNWNYITNNEWKLASAYRIIKYLLNRVKKEDKNE